MRRVRRKSQWRDARAPTDTVELREREPGPVDERERIQVTPADTEIFPGGDIHKDREDCFQGKHDPNCKWKISKSEQGREQRREERTKDLDTEQVLLEHLGVHVCVLAVSMNRFKFARACNAQTWTMSMP